MGRRVVHSASDVQVFDLNFFDSGIANVQLNLGLCVSGGVDEVHVGHDASLHLLSDPRLKVCQPRDSHSDSALRKPVARSKRDIALGVRAFPIGAFDRGEQRPVAATLESEGEFEWRAIEATLRVDPACGRTGKPLQTRRCLDRPTRESFGPYLAGRIRDKV